MSATKRQRWSGLAVRWVTPRSPYAGQTGVILKRLGRNFYIRTADGRIAGAKRASFEVVA